jgi:hypothetical protein
MTGKRLAGDVTVSRMSSRNSFALSFPVFSMDPWP